MNLITQTTAISTVELIKRLNLKLNKTTYIQNLENLVDDGVLHSFSLMTGSSGICNLVCRNCLN